MEKHRFDVWVGLAKGDREEKSRVVDDVPIVGLTDDYLWRWQCFPGDEEPLT